MTDLQSTQKESTELLKLVTFRISNEVFGVETLKVQEIMKMTHITEIPNSPDFIEGIMNLRGRIIPIIDLRKKLGLEALEFIEDKRIIIVVDVLGKTVGFIVDAVNEVLRLPANITEPPPHLALGVNSEYITSVGKLDDRLLLLLDLEKVLLEEEKAFLSHSDLQEAK